MTVLVPAGSQRPPKPRSWPRRTVIGAVLLAITWWSAQAIDVDFGAITRNYHNATRNIRALLRPDFGFFPKTTNAWTETLEMAVIATAVGASFSLPLSFLASRSTNPNAGWRVLTRSVMNVVRSVPDLLYASLLVTAVGTGALSGVLALFFFNLGILVKLVSDALDAADRGGQEAARAAGATWPAANRWAMLPEIAPVYVSQTIYVLEVNVRASTVLGLVGAGGIGRLIDDLRTFYRYEQLSFVILEILVVIVLLEVISATARKRLVR